MFQFFAAQSFTSRWFIIHHVRNCMLNFNYTNRMWGAPFCQPSYIKMCSGCNSIICFFFTYRNWLKASDSVLQFVQPKIDIFHLIKWFNRTQFINSSFILKKKKNIWIIMILAFVNNTFACLKFDSESKSRVQIDDHHREINEWKKMWICYK